LRVSRQVICEWCEVTGFLVSGVQDHGIRMLPVT
jgi:hypothetical protein